MTESEDIADEYFAGLGIQLEKNGYPDRWRIETSGRMHCIEYKLEGTDLDDQQLCMRNVLIKVGIHYQLVLITKKGEVKVAFDSDLHTLDML